MTQPLWLYATVGLVSCLLTLLLVPVFRSLAVKLDVVDRPSEARKVHARVVPYLGGLPFYLVLLVIVLAINVIAPEYHQPLFFPLCLFGTLITMMGLYDDTHDMGSLKKLVIEIIIASALFVWVFQATEIEVPIGGIVSAGWLAFIITPLWIAGVVNAVNFSDGLDGLAGGLVFICAAALFAIGFSNGQVGSCILMAYLMGTTLGFLRYNFNPASVFMGDTGALFLGFVLGTSTLVQQQKGVTVIALVVPMVVMAIPFLDTVLSFERRLRRARSGAFFTPDRDHLHHRLLALGLTQKQVVLSLYYLSVCMAILAYVLSVLPPGYSVLILVLAAMAIAFGVAVLRFLEAVAQTEHPEETGVD